MFSLRTRLNLPISKLSRMSNSKGELQDEIIEKSSAEMA